MITIHNFIQPCIRINNDGGNCNIDDIVTWWAKKDNEQKYGIIIKKLIKSVKIKMIEANIINHNLELNILDNIDDVCYNYLQYRRKIILIQATDDVAFIL